MGLFEKPGDVVLTPGEVVETTLDGHDLYSEPGLADTVKDAGNLTKGEIALVVATTSNLKNATEVCVLTSRGMMGWVYQDYLKRAFR